MPRFAANLSFLFTETDFLNRFQRASDCGFRGVEFLFPYEWSPLDIRDRLDRTGLTLALFNLYPGNWEKGECGLASLPGREEEFENTVHQALEYAEKTGCRKLHILAGIPTPDMENDRANETYLNNLSRAADIARHTDITLLIEPINRRNIPDYFLWNTEQARNIIKTVGADNLKLQFDFYHCQITEGDVSTLYKNCLTDIGHIQIANPPLRSEPDVGELNYVHIFEMIDQSEYNGWVGCEYKPSKPVETTLEWAEKYGIWETIHKNSR